ncbi:Ribosomal protein L49/IMG2 [Penicillium capsulatum]|uniref:Large ribosomal subunit protein mL49 n=1 Tax=Penicillium capsulatum TaxID=69766 RepID=A0A9W9HSF8_9EURO|nr:Ribosomal protein L49/IMG2 [Penicillium capsulatum]KAJ6105735.1 Ribosomal protein L49/IMG2 [Penicillium capsulatum]
MASMRHQASVVSALCRQATNPRWAQSVASAQSCSSRSLSAPTWSASSPHLRTLSKTTLTLSQTRTFLTQLRRQAQALKEQPVSEDPAFPRQAQKPKQPLQLTNLPYFVRRTGSNQLPIYLVTKAGGTKQLTKIQKTEGDTEALRSDLAQALGVDMRSPDVSINRLNGHIIVKGWRKPEIVQFLKERNF